MRRTFLPPLVITVALLASNLQLAAQPLTVLEETFLDGERLTQTPPASLAWYVPTTAVSVLQVRPRALVLVANDRDRSVRGYFPPISLKIGDSVTLLVEFNFSRTPPSLPEGFKAMLGYTNGIVPRRADGTVTGAYQGYGNFTNPGTVGASTRLLKRNGPAAANPTASLLEVTDGTAAISWATFGAARSGLASAFQAGIPYACSLRITRTDSDAVAVTTTLTGAGLGPTNSFTETDVSGIFANFDTVAIGAADTSLAGDLTLTRVSIVHDRSTARLNNLSILTSLADATDSFTMGYVVGGVNPATAKPLVIRAAGPSLGALGVAGIVEDPKLELFAGTTKTGENDNWGGSSSLAAAMLAVGAFPYQGPGSKDAAVAASVTTRDNSVTVTGTGAGIVIAEIYDATPATSFTSTTPRLANVSVLKHLGTGMTAGFVVGGSGARQVLIRAIGPTLGVFGVSGTVTDPQLRLFAGANVIGGNDNWSGTPALAAAFNAVGAFALDGNSRDAALVATLAPGNYTVEVSGANATSGVALLEIYEVP